MCTVKLKAATHVAAPVGAAPALRKPAWLRAPLAPGREFTAVKQIVRQHRLSSVCEEAKCPNIGECWNAGTATIMVMGAVYTRACRFCAVDTGNPRGWSDQEEPENVARSVELMGLKYVAFTSVNPPTFGGKNGATKKRRQAWFSSFSGRSNRQEFHFAAAGSFARNSFAVVTSRRSRSAFFQSSRNC